MKNTKIITLALLATALVVGCSKKEQLTPEKGHINIFANNFERNGSKVSIDPSNPGSDANWIVGEYVTLNGTEYTIEKFDQGNYYINTDPVAEDMVSFYPGENTNGNDVEIDGNTIVLNRLKINFLDGERQSIAFPMVATAGANASSLYYNHLTGGFQLKLVNQSGQNIDLASMTIVAQSTTPVVNLGDDNGNYFARWAVEGPQVPMGYVGQDEDNIDVRYSSVMNFDFENCTISNGGEKLFCVPVTISSVNKLKITGYDSDGAVLFSVKKNFANAQPVLRNKMYSLPEITINSNK